jgi:hypothetical protein
MEQIEDDNDDHEGENYGDNAATVPCLAIAGNLLFRRLNVTVRGYGAIGIPAKRTAGSEEYESQSVGGRTHLPASLALALALMAWAYVDFRARGTVSTRRIAEALVMT